MNLERSAQELKDECEITEYSKSFEPMTEDEVSQLMVSAGVDSAESENSGQTRRGHGCLLLPGLVPVSNPDERTKQPHGSRKFHANPFETNSTGKGLHKENRILPGAEGEDRVAMTRGESALTPRDESEVYVTKIGGAGNIDSGVPSAPSSVFAEQGVPAHGSQGEPGPGFKPSRSRMKQSRTPAQDLRLPSVTEGSKQERRPEITRNKKGHGPRDKRARRTPQSGAYGIPLTPSLFGTKDQRRAWRRINLQRKIDRRHISPKQRIKNLNEKGL